MVLGGNTPVRPFSLWREDLVAAVAALSLVLGLFIDGWNHINLQDGALGSFFTPWHALLYAGFAATAGWVCTRNAHLYVPDRHARPEFHRLLGIPLRYPFAVAGLAIATVGLLGDIAWHTAFGEETGVARVIAPFHLMLFSGAALLIAAPLRSAWHAPDTYPARLTLRQMAPPLLSLTLVTATVAFMFQWLSAFVDWAPSLQLGRVPAAFAANEEIHGTVEFAGAARVLVTNVVLIAPVLAVLRRWRLPFGSVALMWTAVALLMSALTEFDLWAAVLAAALGGLAADGVIRLMRGPDDPEHDRGLFRVLGAVAPVVLWTAYFLLLQAVHAVAWPTDLWIGTVVLTAVTGVALSFVTASPARLEPVGFSEHTDRDHREHRRR